MYGTQASDIVPEFHIKLQNYDDIPTKGENRKSWISLRESTLYYESGMKGIYNLSWKFDFNVSGSSSGLVALCQGLVTVEQQRAKCPHKCTRIEGSKNGYYGVHQVQRSPVSPHRNGQHSNPNLFGQDVEKEEFRDLGLEKITSRIGVS